MREPVNKGTNLLDSILTVEDYIERKIRRCDDSKIAADLYVSIYTLERWKTKVGVKRIHVNQKRYLMIEEMLENGLTAKDAAKRLKTTLRNVDYIRKKFSNGNKMESNN